MGKQRDMTHVSFHSVNLTHHPSFLLVAPNLIPYTFLSDTVYVKGISIAMDYRLDSLGLIPGSTRFFSFAQYPDQLWGPPSFLFSGYQSSVPGDKSTGASS
jgi:hypothetical protein